MYTKYIVPYIKDEYICPQHKLNVIHARGGDASYKKKFPNTFYDNLIKQFGKCTIVHGDDRHENNTVKDSITYLKDKYKNDDNITLQSSSLVNDINTIVNAENLVISVGTFAIAMYMLSTTIKNVYSYNYKSLGLVPPGNDPNVNFIDIVD